ncbi:SOH1-domain-containing protein [Entophlyctis helioformis]|nr:SOH1-domain-containing protein [Entophlyctis helioformis]
MDAAMDPSQQQEAPAGEQSQPQAAHNQKPTQQDLVPTDPEKVRFLLELEFVQCLANPAYLQFLAQQRYFDDKAFVNYLQYLTYWQQPQYAKYIQFPYSLAILDLLQHEPFRRACASADTAAFLHKKQFFHWEAYRTSSWTPPKDAADLRSLATAAAAPLSSSASASAASTAAAPGIAMDVDGHT